jgi:carbonic anhydrase/acetyltransferase-like protein (isoleucine patch superfamily)
MPAVLTIEALTQLAAVLVLDRAKAPLTARVSLRGVDSAKFRRSVVPGDRLRLEVEIKRARTSLARLRAAAYVDDQVVAEADILLAIDVGAAAVHPTAHVDPAAHIGEGTVIGPHAMIGPDVRIGKNCLIGASVVIDGRTYIGDETQIFPMASIGLAPTGPQVPRREDRASHREAEYLSRIRDDQSRQPPVAAVRRRSAARTCSWRTCTWRTTATSGAERFSGRMRRSAVTSVSRILRTSAPGPQSISSVASAATASSVDIRS